MTASEPEILACEPTPLGLLCLRQRTLAGTAVTEITLEHEFLMSSHHSDSERALASRALALHPGRDLSVLVGGLGLGCTAHVALASERVARVEVVELLAPVIDWLDRGLLPLSAALRADPRLAVRQGDVYDLLARPPERPWDLVLIDVDHAPDEPLGASHASFYGSRGLRRARRHLAPGGVLAVWSYAASPSFAATLRRVFRDVRVEPVSFENLVVGGEETNWLFLARD